MIFFWYIFWSAKCVVFVFSVWDVCLFGDNYAGCSIFCAVFSKAENPKLLVILYYSMLNAGHPNAPNWSFALKGFVTWKKLFKRFTKGLEIHKKIPSFIPGIVVPVCFRKKKKKKKSHQRASGGIPVTICKPQWVWCSGLRLCQRIFYGLQTARGWSGNP